ncbi:hypothetical protein [Bradyrhizobium diazoefficiens]|uniref:hypothetical protein n=1 Tax=Bradyrhizobium diazoefficiens TaxID=1355477 RepID=UPI00271509C5|nr:hypothetical protein [Bradyrhizobium diazoefficiens]WLC16641.1 hypothetical protein QIH76_42405 [Bradyrhizobium diazoefficiens]
MHPPSASRDPNRPNGGVHKVVKRSRGSTPSERLLADLGDHAFLKLWSYPNLFYDKKQKGKGDGKEFCDMLVVCGDDVIVFSDKHIKFQEEQPIEVAWPRFYRNAIEGAVIQINGANNWMDRYPERIYLDPACTQKLPIDLPPRATRRVHGVVVATGAHRSIQKILDDRSGSFVIMPALKGRDAIDFSREGFMPFAIGDVNPGRLFVHVFDDVGIKRVLEHLNTISDFAGYLKKRADYIRSNSFWMAHGEEELLANYLRVGAATNGFYDFELPGAKPPKAGEFKMTKQGLWSDYILSETHFKKAIADEKSRVWDDLIARFSENLLAGATGSFLGKETTIPGAEPALRLMAMENRFGRRVLGEAVQGAIVRAMEANQDRYARVILPKKGNNPKLAYVVMILSYPAFARARAGKDSGYDHYREYRMRVMEAYCLAVLLDNRKLNTVVAIGMDADYSVTGQQGGSEDLFCVRIDQWTPSLEARAGELREHYEVFRHERLNRRDISRSEFPPTGGRRQRKNKPSRLRFKKQR